MLFVTPAQAIPLDLSTFDIIDPTVSVYGADSNSATVTEDPFLTPVGLVDTGVLTPADALSLTLSYSLSVLVGNEDFFDFYFGDLSAPEASFGGGVGTYSGMLSRSLSGYAGSSLPLAFVLSVGGSDSQLDSVLTIENVRIVEATSVPEPASGLLVIVGLGVLALARRRGA
jgi:hypothetical protein